MSNLINMIGYPGLGGEYFLHLHQFTRCTNEVQMKGLIFTGNVSLCITSKNYSQLIKLLHNRELSFSLGRPDTLGLDEYHNRCQPSREGDSEYSIIPIAVDLAHMIRQVSVDLYHSRATIQQRMKDSLAIEQRLNKWLDELPKILQPDFGQPGGSVNTSISALRDPKWSRRQRLVLGIRTLKKKLYSFPSFYWLSLTALTVYIEKKRLP